MAASPSTFKGGLDRDSVGQEICIGLAHNRQAGKGTSGPAAATLNGVEGGTHFGLILHSVPGW